MDKELKKIEKKLDVLNKRYVSMTFENSTKAQRDRLRAAINELCMDRAHLLGRPVRERVGDRSI